MACYEVKIDFEADNLSIRKCDLEYDEVYEDNKRIRLLPDSIGVLVDAASYEAAVEMANPLLLKAHKYLMRGNGGFIYPSKEVEDKIAIE